MKYIYFCVKGHLNASRIFNLKGISIFNLKMMERVRSLVRCSFDRNAVLDLLRSRGMEEHCSWEGQEAFVQTVLHDQVLKKFPVLAQYKARLLRAYLDDVTQRAESEVYKHKKRKVYLVCLIITEKVDN